MSQWFRMYAGAVRDPKVAMLSDADFRLWIKLLSVACERDGVIPPLEQLKRVLNARLDHLLAGVKRLISVGLIDPLDDGYEPHAWSKRQYKSDTSTERVRRHRGKMAVSVTAPDTETDTETDIPPPNGGGPPADFDPVKMMFDSGIALITSTSALNDKQARSWLGKALKECGAEAVIVAIGMAKRSGSPDVIPYMTAILKKPPGNAKTGGATVRGVDKFLNRFGEGNGNDDAQGVRGDSRALPDLSGRVGDVGG